MRVLIACEESQRVTIAFRERGHEAYSCDIQPCSGGHPEWHIQADALELLKLKWDLIIAHPPCTYLSNAGAVRMFPGGATQRRAVCKGACSKRVFHEVSERRLPEDMRGESYAAQYYAVA